MSNERYSYADASRASCPRPPRARRHPGRADDALWALLKGGGHAYAPGTFDPPGARADDCATQRNLDEQGRRDARKLGEAFRTRSIPVGDVRSSRWCRCLETGNVILVTHMTNIYAVTGLGVTSGEMVVLTPTGSDFKIAGRLAPNALTAGP